MGPVGCSGASRPMVTAVVLLAAWGFGELSPAGEQTAVPELEILVQADTDTNREHSALYAQSIYSQVRGAFSDLLGGPFSGSETSSSPARYRLFIRYDGRVKASGKGTGRDTGRVGVLYSDGSIEDTGREGEEKWWFFEVRQQGEVHFRFMERQGRRFRTWYEWSIPVSETKDVSIDSGLDFKRGPKLDKFRMTKGTARDQAILEARPSLHIADSALSAMFPLEVLRVRRSAENHGFAYISLRNRSPWPLTYLQAELSVVRPYLNVTGIDRISERVAEIEFSGKLLPGEETVLEVECGRALLRGVKDTIADYGEVLFFKVKEDHFPFRPDRGWDDGQKEEGQKAEPEDGGRAPDEPQEQEREEEVPIGRGRRR